ncbi:hypothetical protein [Bosea sp. PAMC 26642]|uniref:hypothetical protein n=1 Tax=Bosea sp. (strain PAMC 26642) TaxID=1792307 RepID=UPI00076FDF89|nr:hypothetical protein [Bosea sp. PAMC 26642]AMJ62718.1 hypothetical protein AXW83_22605 [Bosea sp. PAMC 26642]
MNRSLNVQTLGSAIVIAAFIAAEAATSLLSAYPRLPLAWYLNLEVFHVFEQARSEPSPLRFLFGPASLGGALIFLAIVCIARLARWRLVIAIAANLSFYFAFALSLAATDRSHDQQTASLFWIAIRLDSVSITSIIVLASFGAAATSHAAYFLEIFDRKAN